MQNKIIDIPVIFGINGLNISDEEKDLFSKYRPYGFVIFSRNCESIEQIISLNNQLINLYPDRKTAIFIDQEGGRVQRIKPPISEVKYPPAEFFANIYETDPDYATKLAEENYSKLASELSSLGINGNFLPCVDLKYDFADNIIGDRSFGSNIEQVTKFANIVKNSHDKFGVKTVMKHIPGHGMAKSDSHLELPIIDSDLEYLEKNDFKIFKNLSNIFEYAMTAHILYNALDSENPVTTSKNAIDYIRKEIGFNGKIITDCITMSALKGSLSHRAESSLKAGCDIVLHCSGKIEEMRKIVSIF